MIQTFHHVCICVSVPGEWSCQYKTTTVFVVRAEVTRPVLTFAGLFQWWAFVTLWRPMCSNRLLTIAQVSSHHVVRALLLSLLLQRKPRAMEKEPPHPHFTPQMLNYTPDAECKVKDRTLLKHGCFVSAWVMFSLASQDTCNCALPNTLSEKQYSICASV